MKHETTTTMTMEEALLCDEYMNFPEIDEQNDADDADDVNQRKGGMRRMKGRAARRHYEGCHKRKTAVTAEIMSKSLRRRHLDDRMNGTRFFTLKKVVRGTLLKVKTCRNGFKINKAGEKVYATPCEYRAKVAIKKAARVNPVQ